MTISIVIPVFNKEHYLAESIASLKNQTYTDVEIIIVDDASTDHSADIARNMASKDPRIHVLMHETNRGTLIARKTGILASTGKYVTFLDPDDLLAPCTCERLIAEETVQPADILHFGVTVVGDERTSEQAVSDMATFMTPTPRTLTGPDIIATVFSSQGFDWNLAHKLFNGDMIRRVAEQLPDDIHMTRSEDAYTFFLAAIEAHTYRALPDSNWYIYHFGRGISSTEAQTLSVFENICEQDALAAKLASDQAQQLANDTVLHASTMLRDKLIEHSMNSWKDNIPAEQQDDALRIARRYWTDTVIAGEIYRFIRDAAYTAFQQLSDSSDLNAIHAELNKYQNILQMLNIEHISTDNTRFTTMRNIANIHLRDFRRREQALIQKKRWSQQSVRIFVTAHKEVEVPSSDILQPVQVGMTANSVHYDWMFHDDEGKNISEKNSMYCELTTQYWAWKNIDADYYGFCHYRRYFNFSDIDYKENSYGEIMDDYIDADAVAKYGLDDRTITDAVQGYDVITTRYGNLKEIIEKHGTPKAVWEAASKLIDEDLHRMYDILCTMHPEYKQDAIAFLNGNRSCFCNMFIMKKEIFIDYCEWLFPLLEQFEKCTDMTHYSKEALRTPGHLAERLLNIYLMHHKRIGSGWKTRELQCVHFTNPEPEEKLSPLDVDVVPSSIVPVVFAADDNYVPQLTTTIYSAMANASSDRFYDVVVLQRNIAWDKQERLRAFFSQRFPNMQLRFTNVDRQVAGVKLTTNNEHISVETYYRFLIQQVLPFYDKVLYLDSDIVINSDISELFDTELGNNLLAAVHDIDFLGNLNIKHGLRMEYARSVLKMHDPYSYFQAGVLVLNTKAMREQYTIEEWLTYASNPEYIYNDQDVLNAHCEGKVVFLDWDWNVMHDCGGRVANVFSYAPNDAYDAYMDSRSHPKIIHYAGYEKPWVNPDCDFASIYWRYARETPFYERLLKKVVKANATEPSVGGSKTQRHERAIGEDNKLRTIVDPLLPLGSRRREALKAVGRVVRGRR